MKKSQMLIALMLGGLSTYLQAGAKRDVTEGYAPATVVSVEKRETPSNYVGDNPADRPLQAREYSYNIGIRLNCNVYVGLYQSAINYLPSDFAPNNMVDVRLRKHAMYISLPYSDWEVKMGILSHRRIKNEPCSTSSLCSSPLAALPQTPELKVSSYQSGWITDSKEEFDESH